MLSCKEEQEKFKKGYRFIGAIDEAGRGPLAGPVVAVCVFINDNFDWTNVELDLVNDSKKIKEKKREEIFNVVTKLFDYGIGIADNKEIDRLNILQATFLAMKKAISNLKTKPEFILIDGNMIIPNISIKQEAIIKGDANVLSIAVASIIAKVTRDRILREYAKEYPLYGFEKHKGYGTKLHLENLKKYGATKIHRQSFFPVKNYKLVNN